MGAWQVSELLKKAEPLLIELQLLRLPEGQRAQGRVLIEQQRALRQNIPEAHLNILSQQLRSRAAVERLMDAQAQGLQFYGNATQVRGLVNEVVRGQLLGSDEHQGRIDEFVDGVGNTAPPQIRNLVNETALHAEG